MQSLSNPYPQLEIDLGKLRDNIDALLARSRAAGVSITGVVKGFQGLVPAVKVYEAAGIDCLASSRLEQLQQLREAGIRTPLMMIRVPMRSELPALVRCADISLHSSVTMLQALEQEAAAACVTHKVILMVDLGDLREGFWDLDELADAAELVERELPHLTLLGVGTNLGCYGTIAATPEKMKDLIRAAERVEARIGRTLDIISGGASTSLHMLLDGTLPKRINHLRVGEGIITGGTWSCDMDFMHKDVFTLHAEVIETALKPSHPVGELSVDAFGKPRSFTDRGMRRRALLAMGRLDYCEPENLTPRVKGIEVLGASSDHTILDIENAQQPIEVGDVLTFDLCYEPILYLSSSRNVSHLYTNEAQGLR